MAIENTSGGRPIPRLLLTFVASTALLNRKKIAIKIDAESWRTSTQIDPFFRGSRAQNEANNCFCTESDVISVAVKIACVAH